MGNLCAHSSNRYSVSFGQGSRSMVLRSEHKSLRSITNALATAMTAAPFLPGGGYDISGVTRVFTEYKHDSEWPLHYRKQIVDAINVTQFRLRLSSSNPVIHCNSSVCTFDIGTDVQLLSVRRY